MGKCHMRNRYRPGSFWIVVALHQMLGEMNKMKRLSFLYLPFVAETDRTSQVTNCKGMSNIGLLLLTHQRIMTSCGKHTTLELPHGSLRVTH
jgi:hypothetical protein